MVIEGIFAVMGLLLLALHLARPGVLRWIVLAETQLWRFLPWVKGDMLDPDGRYQRVMRAGVVTGISMLTVMSLVLFIAPYTDELSDVLGPLS
ncbi:MAG: hypothetical protein WCI61_10770 [Chloroflexota bacterium]